MYTYNQSCNSYSPVGPLYIPNPNLPTYMSPIPLNYINCVLEPTAQTGGLFLGDVVSVRKPEVLLKNNIKAVLSCGNESCYDPVSSGYKGVQDYKVILAKDLYDYDMSQHFAETYDFIERHLQAGHNTLVHCHAGKSRSVTIVIAYLMKKYTWTYDQALAYVKQRRPRVKPNDSFVLQLKQFQKVLFPGISSDVPSNVTPDVPITSVDMQTSQTQTKSVDSLSNMQETPLSSYGMDTMNGMSAPNYSSQGYYQAQAYNQPMSNYNPALKRNLFGNDTARQGIYSSQANNMYPLGNVYRQSAMGDYGYQQARPFSRGPSTIPISSRQPDLAASMNPYGYMTNTPYLNRAGYR